MRVRLHELQPWTAGRIGTLIQQHLFNRSVLVVPECNWTGYECDLLVIEKGLRIIDIEIKISRSDLKADITKDKWWKSRPWSRRHLPRERREWPEKVWKHYYCMPASIWKPELLAAIPATSGVLLLDVMAHHYISQGRRHAGITKPTIKVIRPAKPCREAKPISAQDAIDIARLANLRMWAAITRKESA